MLQKEYNLGEGREYVIYGLEYQELSKRDKNKIRIFQKL